MAKQQIIRKRDAPERFDELLETVPEALRDGHPLYGAFGRRYYPAAFTDLRDQSFAVVARDGTCVVVECDVLDGTFGRFAILPARLMPSTGTTVSRRLARAALEEMCAVGASERAEQLLVADGSAGHSLGQVGQACLSVGGRLVTRIDAIADLSLTEAELWSGVRDRYRTYLNWGRESLNMTYCNVANPDRGLFDAYRSLHEHAAGGPTRTDESWEVRYDALIEGGAELSLAELDGELVASVFVADGATVSYYVSGAYLRERFDLPLAHWPLMDAILRAKARRLEHFDVGEVPYRGQDSEKMHQIGFFKRGFTACLEVRMHWEIDFDHESRA